MIITNEDNDNNHNNDNSLVDLVVKRKRNNNMSNVDDYDCYVDWKKGDWCWLSPLSLAINNNITEKKY